MATIALMGEKDNKRVVVKTVDAVTRISCKCCTQLQFSYAFNPVPYGGILQCVSAFGGQNGICCDTEWPYVVVFDDPGNAGEILVADAKQDGLWSSTVNIDFYAAWNGDSDAGIIPYPGGTLSVTYLGATKSIYVATMNENPSCDTSFVTTVVVSSDPLEDKTFFEFL